MLHQSGIRVSDDALVVFKHREHCHSNFVQYFASFEADSLFDPSILRGDSAKNTERILGLV